MKGSLTRMALVAVFLQLSCSSAQAVTWSDSNTRPDGVGDANNNGNVYMAPAEDGAQIVYGGQDGEVIGDVFDSGD